MKKLFVFAITVALLFLGCAENLASGRVLDSLIEPVAKPQPEYAILGYITTTKEFTSTLGLYKKGGLTYSDVLLAAKREYHTVDEVINIKYDYTTNSNFLFRKRTDRAYGLAIKYNIKP